LSPVEFTKVSGAGNDFIIIDDRDGRINPAEAGPLVEAVCRRRTSIGADGVILIVSDPALDFKWHFYNADGGEAEMCGNGARCAARFAYESGIAGRKMSFRTLAGVIDAEVLDDGVRIGMTEPAGFVGERTMQAVGREFEVWFIDTGVPHAVVFVEDVRSVPLHDWGRALRFHEMFAPAGANANFVMVEGSRIWMRTYERGVEGETLACGTGAVASALIAHTAHALPSPVDVVTRSGEVLSVGFASSGEPGSFRDVFLEGPAKMIARGEILPEAAPGVL